MEGMRRFKHGALALAQYALANRAQVRLLRVAGCKKLPDHAGLPRL
jgi:hypothetical protein